MRVAGCGNSLHGGRVLTAHDIPWLAGASRDERWLVGVSGGADSVALLHLLAREGFRSLVVCHLNHCLRGEDSGKDAAFVEGLAHDLEVPVDLGALDVAAIMRESGESLETAARRARHGFFRECAKRHGSNRILLAHHADDQAETALWNFLRGSHGLKGMRDRQILEFPEGDRLELHRPLLGIRKARLVEWLKAGNHEWREDGSNRQPVAIRNRLRQEAFPLLEEITGRDPVSPWLAGVEIDAERAAAEMWMIERLDLLDPQGRLYLPKFRELPVALQRAALWRFLDRSAIGGLNRDTVARGLALLEEGGPASINLPGGAKLRRSGGRLWIQR